MVGEIVAVYIQDLFGLLVAQLCLKAGARVVGIIFQESMQAHAQRCGITTLLSASDETLATSIALLTGNHGVDVTFVPSSYQETTPCDPVLITRKKGRVVLGSSSTVCSSALALHKELKFLFFSTYGAGTDEACYEKGCDYPVAHVRWTEQRNAQAFIRCIVDGSINESAYQFAHHSIDDIGLKKPFTYDVVPLGLYITYFTTKDDHRIFTVKPAVKDRESLIHSVWVPAARTTLRVGLVGAPKLSLPRFVPYLSSIRSARVVAVADEDITDAANLAHAFGTEKVYRTAADLLEHENVDVIMVTSQYGKRTADVIQALAQGKAVYVEKPLATTMNDLHLLEQLAGQYGTMPLCVDHYRLYSPLIEQIREVTDKRSGPLMIQYRMNAGGIAKAEMMQVDRGAGRIISDASHIMHLFCTLTHAEPTTVSVEALHSIESNLFPTDNFMVVIGFSDGSICQLTYTLLGHPGMGTERMEIFVDGKSIILDDYQALYGFGTPSWFNTTLAQPDKGHNALLKAFFKSLKQEDFNPVFSWKELRESTRLTLLVDQLACQGGGSSD
jgi:predicted dehydrogenase